MRAASKMLHGILLPTARSSPQHWRRNVASRHFDTSRQPLLHDSQTTGVATDVSTTSMPRNEPDVLKDGAKRRNLHPQDQRRSKREKMGAVSAVVIACVCVQLCHGFSPALHSLPPQRGLGLARLTKPIARAKPSLLRCQAGDNEEEKSKSKDGDQNDWMSPPVYTSGTPLSGQPPTQPRTSLARALAEGRVSEQGPQIAANGKTKYISIFDLFSIGLGPSSSHTVGPMRASYRFLELNKDFIPSVKRIRIELFGSLALTGKGHHTDYAAILGACGFMPATIDIDRARKIYSDVCATKKLNLMDEADVGCSVVIPFDPAADVILHKDKTLPEHPNGMLITLSALQEIPEELSMDYVPPKDFAATTPTGRRMSGPDAIGAASPTAAGSEEAVVDFHASKLACDASLDPSLVRRREYYSVGGGFILDEDAIRHVDDPSPAIPVPSVPYAFETFEDLASICEREGLTIAEVMMANELAAPDVASVEDVEDRILEIWDVMDRSIISGMETDGPLPGGLAVRRRARNLRKKLQRAKLDISDSNWLNVFAIAVNEENAAGSKVVTAPTNGAAGTIPAVLKFYLLNYQTADSQVRDGLRQVATAKDDAAARGDGDGDGDAAVFKRSQSTLTEREIQDANEDLSGSVDEARMRGWLSKYHFRKKYEAEQREMIVEFMLVTAAVGQLYKKGASISAAEVGCQGEVGVACSMAAAGLASILGGSLAQIEQAAEMSMEHHLGLTCDPIGGLVQIPCIERNAMGAAQAWNAAKLALLGDGAHYVSLDDVIRTMKSTGDDMSARYKETSLAGLAKNARVSLNMPAC